MGVNYRMTICTILKGYCGDREIYALCKQYGSGETAENFICEIEATEEVKKEYERQKDVFNHTGKKKLFSCRNRLK